MKNAPMNLETNPETETLTFEYLAGGQGFENYVRRLRAARRKRKDYETQKVLYVTCISFAFVLALVVVDFGIL